MKGLIKCIAREQALQEPGVSGLLFDEEAQKKIIPAIAQKLLDTGQEPKKVSVIWYEKSGDFIIVTGDGFLPYQEVVEFELAASFPVRGEETWREGDLIKTISRAKGDSTGGPDEVKSKTEIDEGSKEDAALRNRPKRRQERADRGFCMAQSILDIRDNAE